MNEFIVWDNLEEEWVDEEYIARYSNGVLFVADLDNEVVDLLHNENDKENRYVPFDYMEMLDINGNKIYSDSSIFKFNLGLYSDRKIAQGYFNYDSNMKRYNVLILNNFEINKHAIYEYNPFTMGKFEIIDNIQENKLGLIK